MLAVSKKLPFCALRLLAWVNSVETIAYCGRGSLAVCLYALQSKIQIKNSNSNSM